MKTYHTKFFLHGLGFLFTMILPSLVQANTKHDFDGDGFADFATRRIENSTWYILNSSGSDIYTENQDGITRKAFGLQSGDIPVSADYDGDGVTDIAVRRASNSTWYIFNSSGVDPVTGYSDGITRKVFGMQPEDIPVPADYDGDGKADIAVRRASNYTWYILNSSGIDAITNSSDGITRKVFGRNETDLPVPADYDGDGKADIAFRRGSNFTWYILNSSGEDGITNNADGITRKVFGRHESDIAVPADYDGDGIADIAVRRALNYTWYILNSSGVDQYTGKNDGITRKVFGKNENDIPVPADYDADGKADIAVRRGANTTFYVLNSGGTNFNSDKSDGIQRIRFSLEATDIPSAATINTKLAMLSSFSNDGDNDEVPQEGTVIDFSAFEDTALGNCVKASDITIVELLESLSCTNMGIVDLSGIEQLQALNSLNLHQNYIANIDALASLNALESLTLSSNAITVVHPIAYLANLKTLNLDDNQMEDLSPLHSLYELNELRLNNNNISSLNGFEVLSQLTTLHLANNLVNDISPIASSYQLTTLNLDSNQIEELEPLENLTNLRDLDLSNNLISDISVLINLVNLNAIDLRGNNSIACEALSNLETYLQNTDIQNPTDCSDDENEPPVSDGNLVTSISDIEGIWLNADLEETGTVSYSVIDSQGNSRNYEYYQSLGCYTLDESIESTVVKNDDGSFTMTSYSILFDNFEQKLTSDSAIKATYYVSDTTLTGYIDYLDVTFNHFFGEELYSSERTFLQYSDPFNYTIEIYLNDELFASAQMSYESDVWQVSNFYAVDGYDYIEQDWLDSGGVEGILRSTRYSGSEEDFTPLCDL